MSAELIESDRHQCDDRNGHAEPHPLIRHRRPLVLVPCCKLRAPCRRRNCALRLG
jgi:hypothetical protein